MFNQAIINSAFQSAVQRSVKNNEYTPVDIKITLKKTENKFKDQVLSHNDREKVENFIYQQIRQQPSLQHPKGLPKDPFRFWK
jgi:hypothetical protein